MSFSFTTTSFRFLKAFEVILKLKRIINRIIHMQITVDELLSNINSIKKTRNGPLMCSDTLQGSTPLSLSGSPTNILSHSFSLDFQQRGNQKQRHILSPPMNLGS